MKINNKILIGAIIVLALINVFAIFFILKKCGPNTKKGDPKQRIEMIAKRLEFTPEQTIEFEKAYLEHRTWVDKNAEDVLSLRKKMFAVAQTNDTLQLQELAEEIGENQANKEKKTALHFASIRKWCTPKQQRKFDRMLLRQMERMQNR